MDYNFTNQPASGLNANSSKKRSTQEFIRAQQLTHKFKAKSDFIHYFSEARKRILILINLPSVQLYLPPKTMFNKDFLK